MIIAILVYHGKFLGSEGFQAKLNGVTIVGKCCFFGCLIIAIEHKWRMLCFD